jgi:PKD repeat protein
LSKKTAERLTKTPEQWRQALSKIKKLKNKCDFSKTQFSFVDQSEGSIQERLWVFDDGSTENQINSNIHYAYHYYDKPGTYTPNLLLTSTNSIVNKIIASSPIKVL